MENLIATNIDSKTNIRKYDKVCPKDWKPSRHGWSPCTSKKIYRAGSDEINQQNRRQSTRESDGGAHPSRVSAEHRHPRRAPPLRSTASVSPVVGALSSPLRIRGVGLSWVFMGSGDDSVRLIGLHRVAAAVCPRPETSRIGHRTHHAIYAILAEMSVRCNGRCNLLCSLSVWFVARKFIQQTCGALTCKYDIAKKKTCKYEHGTRWQLSIDQLCISIYFEIKLWIVFETVSYI
jgi:hypothetical protein